MKHSIEEKESLLDLLEHQGLATLLKEMDALVEGQGRSMLKYDLSTGSEVELVRLKCRHEGAHKLLSDFKRRIEALKVPAKS